MIRHPEFVLNRSMPSFFRAAHAISGLFRSETRPASPATRLPVPCHDPGGVNDCSQGLSLGASRDATPGKRDPRNLPLPTGVERAQGGSVSFPCRVRGGGRPRPTEATEEGAPSPTLGRPKSPLPCHLRCPNINHTTCGRSARRTGPTTGGLAMSVLRSSTCLWTLLPCCLVALLPRGSGRAQKR